MSHRVFIDGCAVNRFATINMDPSRELAGTPFELVVTSRLEAEYRQALAHRFVEPHVKALLRNLLASASRLTVDESQAGGARLGADADLIALSASAVVVTDDRKAVWTRNANPGLIIWRDVEAAITRGVTFLDLVRKRAAKLG